MSSSEAQKRYYEKNKERINAKRRVWAAANRDKLRKYSSRYYEKSREAKRRYAEAHPEEVKQRKRAWFDKNPNYLRSYYAKNRTRYLVKQAQRRALAEGVPFDISEEDILIPDICPVLGIPIMLNARGAFNPHSPSIDRFDPSAGYIRGNVHVISNRANLLKRDATTEEVTLLALWMTKTSARKSV